MDLRPLAIFLMSLAFLFSPAAPALAQDDPGLNTACERYEFLGAKHLLRVSPEILDIAETVCNARPHAAMPPLRHFGDTYTPRPLSDACENKTHYPICVADWVEAVQYFQDRPVACFELFKQNNAAGNHKVTCPIQTKSPKPPSADEASPAGDGWTAIGTIGAILLVALMVWLGKGDSPYRPS